MEESYTKMAASSKYFSLVVLVLGLVLQLGSIGAQDEVLFASSKSEIFSNSKGLTKDGVIGAEKDIFGFHHITYDTADVTVQNSLNEGVTLWMQSTECYQCKLLNITTVDGGENVLIKVDTAWGVNWMLSLSTNSTPVCKRTTYHFGEMGNYSLVVGYNSSEEQKYCSIITNSPPENSNLPIYVAIGVYGGLAVLYIIILQIVRSGMLKKFLSFFSAERLIYNDLGTPTLNATEITINNTNGQKKSRLRSLDTFRGIAICIMIFVNYGGGKYWFFTHARWNGLTLADLAFPWFVFIMGASVKLSQAALYRRGVTRGKIFLKIIKRSVILFGLGLVLQAGNDLHTYRVPGVLQRLAASYFVGASLQLLSLRPPKVDRPLSKFYRLFEDILDYWYEWIIILLLMLGYCCVTYLVQVGNCPKGYVGPGGLNQMDSSLVNCTGGVARIIDNWLFHSNHIYQHPTCMKIYNTVVPYDPEGTLGTITSIFLTFLGIQVSKILHTYNSHTSRLSRMVIWGIITGGLATLLCGASKENGWIPVNKNLWSPSYVLASAGLAFILLSLCYLLIDVVNWWSGVPFYFAGMNSIFIYIGHEIIVDFAFPFSWQPLHGTHAEYLAMNLIGVSLWVVISMWLYYVDFFLKI